MALVRIAIEPTAGPLPALVARFIGEANARIDRFHATRVKRPLHGFVPSDFEQAWRTLDALAKAKLPSGKSFCEWGCGFAAVAGLARLCGYDAAGIEIERDLLDEARRLTADFALDVALALGSFVPQDAGDLAACNEEFSWIVEGGPDGHAVLRRDPDDFDVVFAYPWPGEEEVIERLFENFAASDALLVTFHGKEGLRVLRKVTDLRCLTRRPGDGGLRR